MDITLRSPSILACLIILSAEVFAAIVANAIIQYLILHESYKKKHVLPTDKIRIALQMSTCCFSIVSYAYLLCDILWPDLFTTLYINGILISLTIYSASSCSWLTALLCFILFTKIADVRSGLLALAKKMMNSSAKYLIIVINMLCLGISFLSMVLLTTPEDPSTNSSVILPVSITYGRRAAHLIVGKFTLAMVSVPFLASTISALLTVRFLKLHGHMMGKNMGGSGDDTLKIYQNVVTRMTQFLFLQAVFYLVFFLFFLSSFSQQSPGYWVTMILMLSYSPTQFIIIIHYPPLKNTWKDLPQCMICCKQFQARNH